MVFANRLLACMERPDPMHQGSSQYLHCVIEAKETENDLRESVERQMVAKQCTGNDLMTEKYERRWTGSSV